MLGGQAHRIRGRERRFDRPGELTFVARLGADGGWGNFIDVAIKRKALGAIGGPQDLDHFIEVLVRLRHRVAERGILMRRDAAPNPQVQTPPLQQDIEHGDLVRQPHGIPPRGDDHRRPHVDPAGAAGPVRQVL